MSTSSWTRAEKDPAKLARIVERLQNPDDFLIAFLKVLENKEADLLTAMRNKTSGFSEFDRGAWAQVEQIRKLLTKEIRNDQLSRTAGS